MEAVTYKKTKNEFHGEKSGFRVKNRHREAARSTSEEEAVSRHEGVRGEPAAVLDRLLQTRVPTSLPATEIFEDLLYVISLQQKGMPGRSLCPRNIVKTVLGWC